MDWLEVAKQVGVPFTFLAGFLYAAWRSLQWYSMNVILPREQQAMKMSTTVMDSIQPFQQQMSESLRLQMASQVEVLNLVRGLCRNTDQQQVKIDMLWNRQQVMIDSMMKRALIEGIKTGALDIEDPHINDKSMSR
jgi:ABC-type transport system involved in cytochrome c biogenesis permease subunit